jgi:hypothetical protein
MLVDVWPNPTAVKGHDVACGVVEGYAAVASQTQFPETGLYRRDQKMGQLGFNFREHELSSTVWSSARIAGCFGAQRR